MTKLQQVILLKQYKTIVLAIQYGKLNEEKMIKALDIKKQIEEKLGL